MKGRRAVGRWLSLSAVLTALASPTAAQPEPTLRAAVQSAYLYRFVHFVTWPAGPPADEFVFCVVGEDPLGIALDRTLSGQLVDGAPARARRLSRAEPGGECKVMFVAGSRRQSAAEALAGVRGEPILTVVDAQRARGARAIVNLIEIDGRIRFTVDLGLAEEAGLTISSKLLDLAVDVRQPAERP